MSSKQKQDVPRNPTSQGISGRLVEAQWLKEHMNDPDLVIIDASGTADYIKGHIPGAVSASFSPEDYISHGVNTSYGGGVDFFTDQDAPIPFQDGPPEQIQKVLRSMGINNESTVVIYAMGADMLAVRFSWTLNYFGNKKNYILDGGLSKWMAEGYPTTTDIPEAGEGNFKASVHDPSIKVDTDYVLGALKKPDTIVVSGLWPNWHTGAALPYSRRGHIPHSVNVPFESYFRQDKTWKSEGELMAMFEYVGVTRDKEVICYCGGSPVGSCTFFTLKYVLGYPDVKFYPDSMLGWIVDPRDLAFWNYDDENLLRDTEWVQWWGGERIQYLMSDTRVRIVDCRSRKQYDAGHIPYAIHIPVDDLFKKFSLDHEAWEDFLGKNGIGNDAEVAVYDDEISSSATFLFWLMEYFGHEKVSVYKDGFASWSSSGYNVTQDDTIITEQTHAFDVAVSPKTYNISFQNQKRLADKEEPVLGVFPKVWIVSSEKVPENVPADDYVHIPWGDNMYGDDKIKSAADLWGIYEEAGVSKFSEVVCYSNSIQEAAFTYFVLKLLGFPNVRVYLP